MRSKFPEESQVLESRLKVSDIGLVPHERNAVNCTHVVNRSVLPDSALGRCNTVAVADPIHGSAGIKVVVVARVVLVLLDVRLLLSKEQTGHPVKCPMGFGHEADLFRPWLIVELITADD